MPRGLLANPRAALAEPRLDALAQLAVAVTEAPWRLTRAELARWRAAGLADDDILHALALSAFFGHLNRIADAVAVPLDYHVRHQPPPIDPQVPAWPAAPPQPRDPDAPSAPDSLDLSRRPATASALAAWRAYVMEREAPLPRPLRELLASQVAGWLGDAAPDAPPQSPHGALEAALITLARQLTLAPWQLGEASFAQLRGLGLDDAALFDACAVASTAGMLARLAVALRALGATDQP